MCKLKSAIVLKDRIYMPYEHNHHSEMLNELGIKDNSEFPNFVRVEITPVDDDIFNHDLNNWKMHIDQDFIPDWFDYKKTERELKVQLKKFFDKCFIINKIIDDIYNKFIYGIKDSTIERIYGDTKINTILSSSISYIQDNVVIERIEGDTCIKTLCGRVIIVIIYRSVEISNIFGDVQINNIYDNVEIGNINDNSRIINVFGKLVIKNMLGSSQIMCVSGALKIKNITDFSQITIHKLADDIIIDNISEYAIVRDLRKNEILTHCDYKIKNIN